MTTINTSRGPVNIRPTREEDAAPYRDLRLEALLAHPVAFGADYEANASKPVEHWQDRVRRGAGGTHGVAYVAEAAGKLIGMMSLVCDEAPKARHRGAIVGVYVRPEWRGAGIADALLEACIGWGRQLGLRLITLAVVTTNAAAIRCYVRHGFSVYGVEPEALYVNGVYHDELLMVRRL